MGSSSFKRTAADRRALAVIPEEVVKELKDISIPDELKGMTQEEYLSRQKFIYVLQLEATHDWYARQGEAAACLAILKMLIELGLNAEKRLREAGQLPDDPRQVIEPPHDGKIEDMKKKTDEDLEAIVVGKKAKK